MFSQRQTTIGQSSQSGVIKYLDYRLLVATIITIIFIVIIHNRHQFDTAALDQKAQLQAKQQQYQSTQDEKEASRLQYQSVDVMGKSVKYLEAKPNEKGSGVLFLMLHGAKYNASTWKLETNSLDSLSQKGHRVVAVDVPGFGESKDTQFVVKVPERGQFLESLVQEIADKDEKVILVSPSMSGDYAWPFLSMGAKGISAWVPVAPVGVQNQNSIPEAVKQLRVLAIYGQLDPMKKDVEKLKSFFQPDKFEYVEIAQGQHPAYLKDPELFNNKLDELAKSI